MPVPQNSNNTVSGSGITKGLSISLNTGNPRSPTSTRYFRQEVTYTGPNAGAINLVSPSAAGDITAAVYNPSTKSWVVKQDTNILGQGLSEKERQSLATKLNKDVTTRSALNKDLSNKVNQDLTQQQINKTFPQTQKTAGSGGTIPETPSGGANGTGGNSKGSSSDYTTQSEKNTLDTISKGVEARTKYDGDLKYPEAYAGNDYLTIEMIRYVPNRNLGLGAVGEGNDNSGASLNYGLKVQTFGEREKESPIAKFTLPIPSNIIDANPVGWTPDDNLNPVQAYGAGAIGRILSGENIFESAGSETNRAAAALRGNADAAKTALNAKIISAIVGGTINSQLARSTGAIINNNTELLFNSAQLRSFTFSFKMTPRSQKEAEIVKKIIRRLKQGMSVKRTVSGIFLASPNVFKLQFWYVDPEKNIPKEHPYLPKLKVCALQNMSVNYMPDGSYMTYGDGSMVAYDMTLSFAEIDPIFDDDYDKLDKEGPDSVIGY